MQTSTNSPPCTGEALRAVGGVCVWVGAWAGEIEIFWGNRSCASHSSQAAHVLVQKTGRFREQ
eukprot:3689456-Prymnesium_polylepis.1